jgi:heat shock protein HslJ
VKTLAKNKSVTLLVIIAGLLVLVGLVLAWFLLPLTTPGDLQGRQWELISVETTQGVIVWTPSPGAFTLEFQGATVRGHASCNTYGGKVRYIRLTRSINISSVFSTLMGCLPPEGQSPDNESAFYEALATVRTYAIRDNQLYLYFDNSTKALIFR